MGQIARLLQRAQDGAGGLLVLVGPAGSGKTAIVAAAAEKAVVAGSMCCGQPRPGASRDAWCGRSCCVIRVRQMAWLRT